MAALNDLVTPSLTFEEILADGSTLTNPAADTRRLFLGEDGLFHMKDSAGTVTDVGGGTPADILDIPTAETDDTLVLAPDGVGGVEFRAEAGGGGGGLAQSFVGYNTVGGSWEAWTARRQFCKKITLAGAATLVSLDAYLRPAADNIAQLVGTVMADNSNAPGVLLAANAIHTGGGGAYLSNSASMPGAGRWFSLAMGCYLPAGDYWLGINSEQTHFAIAYDGSGSDQYFTPTALYATGAYPSAWAITTSSNKYSIRASILS